MFVRHNLADSLKYLHLRWRQPFRLQEGVVARIAGYDDPSSPHPENLREDFGHNLTGTYDEMVSLPIALQKCADTQWVPMFCEYEVACEPFEGGSVPELDVFGACEEETTGADVTRPEAGDDATCTQHKKHPL